MVRVRLELSLPHSRMMLKGTASTYALALAMLLFGGNVVAQKPDADGATTATLARVQAEKRRRGMELSARAWNLLETGKDYALGYGLLDRLVTEEGWCDEGQLARIGAVACDLSGALGVTNSALAEKVAARLRSGSPDSAWMGHLLQAYACAIRGEEAEAWRAFDAAKGAVPKGVVVDFEAERARIAERMKPRPTPRPVVDARNRRTFKLPDHLRTDRTPIPSQGGTPAAPSPMPTPSPAPSPTPVPTPIPTPSPIPKRDWIGEYRTDLTWGYAVGAVLESGRGLTIRNNVVVPPIDRGLVGEITRKLPADGPVLLTQTMRMANHSALAIDNYRAARKGKAATMRGMGREMSLMYLKAALGGVLGEDPITYRQFLDGPGAWIDQSIRDLRRLEIAAIYWNIINHGIGMQMDWNIEAICRLYLNPAPFGHPGLFEITPIWKLYGNSILENGKPMSDGVVFARGAQVIYRGDTPLTNVVILVRLGSRGVSGGLTAGQLELLGLNAVTGAADHVPDIATYMALENLLSSLPVCGYSYLPRVEPGDLLMAVLPDNIDGASYYNTTVTIYSDQGSMPLKEIDKTK